ncbi:hypothetical protein C351_02468 [Cryptococcus neoformans c8]|nr:hypothetical protein C351_02468 [Cryptococcus neoformans var. grubii c8]
MSPSIFHDTQRNMRAS